MVARATKFFLVAVLAGGFGLAPLTSCGYDGWVRYPCQEQENWGKPECQKPGCIVTGTCTDFLIPEGVKDAE